MTRNEIGPVPFFFPPATLTISLLYKDQTAGTNVTLDSAKVTFGNAVNFYSIFSSRDASLRAPITYPDDDGRTETINAYDYRLKWDTHDPDVKKTAIFIHGYNVSGEDAEKTFSTTYQRMFWQGFRGNFVGWDWDGQQQADPFVFNTDVENALHTSPALWRAIRRMQSPTASGGWVVGPQDIDLLAHSLGNVVMWDALRINAALTPRKLVHNVTSTEAAIFQEAFDPVGPLHYSAPSSAPAGGRTYWLSESVAQQQQSGWRSWFNPSGRNIKSSVAGKVINSYNAQDSALKEMQHAEWFKWGFTEGRAEKFQATANRRVMYKTPPAYRTSSNLNELRTYISPDAQITWNNSTQKWEFDTTDLNRAIGTMANPIADVNVDASTLRWRTPEHSDFKGLNYPVIWPWWLRVVNQEQAVAVGVQ